MRAIFVASGPPRDHRAQLRNTGILSLVFACVGRRRPSCYAQPSLLACNSARTNLQVGLCTCSTSVCMCVRAFCVWVPMDDNEGVPCGVIKCPSNEEVTLHFTKARSLIHAVGQQQQRAGVWMYVIIPSCLSLIKASFTSKSMVSPWKEWRWCSHSSSRSSGVSFGDCQRKKYARIASFSSCASISLSRSGITACCFASEYV
jgi:hypothetical protein